MNTSTMEVGVVIEPGNFAIEHREVPVDIPEDWVLIDICSVGICGTDYHILEGKHPFLAYPRVIGHELSGRVVADGNSWTAGDLVVVNPYLACGTCRACAAGKPNCCYTIAVLGVHRDGGLVSRLAVPKGNLYSAEGLTPTQAAMVEFLAIGAHAVRRSEVSKGDRVMVTGVGPIGIGVALFAQLKGAEVSLLDVSQERLAMASDRFGLKSIFDNLDVALEETDRQGFDAVFDATGHLAAIENGFRAVAHGGSYVLVSVVKDDVSFSDPEFHKREMRLIGSRNALKEDFDWVMDSFRAGQIDTEALCSKRLTLSELSEQFPKLATDRANLVKVIVQLRD